MNDRGVCITALAKPGLLTIWSFKKNSIMYSFKKEISVKKHMLTKHDHHDFKECQKKLPIFMQLLKLMAESTTLRDKIRL